MDLIELIAVKAIRLITSCRAASTATPPKIQCHKKSSWDLSNAFMNLISSSTTAIAALNTGRHFIGIEKEAKYCEIARKRISAIPTKLSHWEGKTDENRPNL